MARLCFFGFSVGRVLLDCVDGFSFSVGWGSQWMNEANAEGLKGEFIHRFGLRCMFQIG